MPKLIKKGTKGTAAQYITRSQAIRKLQLSLTDFRKLCILKGVYPREPKKKLKGTDKTYFHLKDVVFLQHEKILDKMREIKAHEKKIKRAKNRKEKAEVARLERRVPKYSVEHLIKERYPNFTDALNDLDDALCMVNLFASFPSHRGLKIPREIIAKCKLLTTQFDLYVIATHSLRKTFLSIKGIYYQAIILGQTVTWIVPYKFPQRLPFDVDYSIMMNFLEVYLTQMEFVLYKLYKELSLEYPPALLQDSSDDLNSKQSEIKQLQLQITNRAQSETLNISKEFAQVPELQEINNQITEKLKYSNLFKDCKFYLGREVPIQSLEILILSAGGSVYTEEGAVKEGSKSITHQIIDRDMNIRKIYKNREYIQPQWVYDSLNNLFLLPTTPYAPGKNPPAHLSPFVDDIKEGYMPTREKEIRKLKGEKISVITQETSKDWETEEMDNIEEIEGKGDEEMTSDEEEETQKRNEKIKRQLAEEKKELGKLIMNRKTKRLYNHLMKTKKGKWNEIAKLEAKRKAFEAQQTN